jgi:hypothetical protein
VPNRIIAQLIAGHKSVSVEDAVVAKFVRAWESADTGISHGSAFMLLVSPDTGSAL